MTIAQVQVDEAYWHSARTRPGALARMATAWLHIPYPWVSARSMRSSCFARQALLQDGDRGGRRDSAGERRESRSHALVGAFVGIVPVALGLLWYPSLRGIGRTA